MAVRVAVAVVVILALAAAPAAADDPEPVVTEGHVLLAAADGDEQARQRWLSSGAVTSGPTGVVIPLASWTTWSSTFRLEITSPEVVGVHAGITFYDDITTGAVCERISLYVIRPDGPICGTHAVVWAPEAPGFSFRFTEAVARDAFAVSGVVTPLPTGPATHAGVDAAHTGAQDGLQNGAVTPSQAWYVDLDGAGASGPVSTPLIVGGRVYAAHLAEDSSASTLVALDAADGGILWDTTTADVGGEGAWSQPASDGARLFATTADGHLRALDATTGAQLWASAVGGDAGLPVAAHGLVVVASRGGLTALRADTGEAVWSHPDLATTESTAPAVVGTALFATVCGSTYRLDLLTGRIEWEHDRGGCGLDATPVVAEGRVYVRMAGMQFFDTETPILDAVTGRWVGSHHSEVAPVISRGRAYYTSGLNVYAYDTVTNRRLWNTDGQLGGPVVGNGTVYAVDGRYGDSAWTLDVVAFDRNGVLTWRAPLPDDATAPHANDETMLGINVGEGLLAVPAGGGIAAYR